MDSGKHFWSIEGGSETVPPRIYFESEAPGCGEVSSGAPAGYLLGSEEKQTLISNLQSAVSKITFISLSRHGVARCLALPVPRRTLSPLSAVL